MLTFLFNKKSYKRKSRPDEDAGANASLFAKIFTLLRFEKKFLNALRQLAEPVFCLRTSYGAYGIQNAFNMIFCISYFSRP